MSGSFKPPWAKLSKQVSSSMPVQEILRTASADYEVVLSPVQVENLTTGRFHTVEDRFVTGRFNYKTGYMDNWEVVKGRYEIIPNSTIVNKALTLAGVEGLDIDSAGILDNGRKFFVVISCEDQIIAGELFKLYIIVMTSHDGTSPISYYFTAVRAITRTVYRLDTKAFPFVKKKHTPNTEEWTAEATEVRDKYSEWLSEFTTTLNRYREEVINDVTIDAALEEMWPIESADTNRKLKHRDEVLDTIKKLYRAEYNRERTGNTKLSLLSAVFDYYDNYRNMDSDSMIQQSLEMDNYSYRQKIKFSTLLKELP